MIYISNGDWFIKDTEVFRINDDPINPKYDCDLFCGYRQCEDPIFEGPDRAIGEIYLDEEICAFDEFRMIARHSE